MGDADGHVQSGLGYLCCSKLLTVRAPLLVPCFHSTERRKHRSHDINAPAGLNHPDHIGADVTSIAPRDFPSYLAHNVEVALRYFPGGSEAPPPDQFVAAREKEGAALGNILKVHGMGHPNLGRWLSRIPNETLIVWGEKDRLLPSSQAKIWAERIPKAKVHIIPGVGHIAMQEDPKTVTLIGDFLAGK